MAPGAQGCQSPNLSLGNLPANLKDQLQFLQQKNKHMSPQIQQLIQQHMQHSQHNHSHGSKNSQAPPNSQKGSPAIALNQLYNQFGRKPHQGSQSKISPGLNKNPTGQGRSPLQRKHSLIHDSMSQKNEGKVSYPPHQSLLGEKDASNDKLENQGTSSQQMKSPRYLPTLKNTASSGDVHPQPVFGVSGLDQKMTPT